MIDEIIIKIEITQDMVRKFIEISGDSNSIHSDEEFAKKKFI